MLTVRCLFPYKNTQCGQLDIQSGLQGKAWVTDVDVRFTEAQTAEFVLPGSSPHSDPSSPFPPPFPPRLPPRFIPVSPIVVSAVQLPCPHPSSPVFNPVSLLFSAQWDLPCDSTWPPWGCVLTHSARWEGLTSSQAAKVTHRFSP